MTDPDTTRRRALDQLNQLVGDWVEQVNLTGVPAGRMSFRWILANQFLLQRSTIPEPHFPDSTCIISVNDDGIGYTQHYFDTRGVVRTYDMTLGQGRWALIRDKPDFTPLDFAQRFTGTFTDAGTAIAAIWETSEDGKHWHTDFELTYTRIPDAQTPDDDAAVKE
jgi:hypothetical protein